MTVTASDLRDVGILINCALRPKHRPAADPVYRDVLGRYRTEADFRNAAIYVLDGMDLQVLSEAADLDLVVGPRRDSLFAARLADIPFTTGVEQRLLVGLVTAGVAAYAYPTADAFDDDRVRWVRVADLERFLRETCESLKRDAGAPLDDEGLEEAWRVYERMPAVHRPDKGRTAGRLSPSCTTYWVGNVLAWLTDQGMARPADRGADTYQLLERFRVQVREMAGHEAYKLLADARTRDSGLDATVPPTTFDPDGVVDLTDDDPTDDRATDPTDPGGTDPAAAAPGTIPGIDETDGNEQ